MLAPIVCWGELLWDRFPEGAALGGAPANVAWHLAMLGAPVAMATRIGDDADGREARRRMAARGIDTSLVQVDPERATGEVEVTLVAGAAGPEPRYRLVPGRAWERIDADAAARAAIAAAPAVIFGTLAQRTPAGLAGWRAAMAARGATTLAICDPNLRPGVVDADADRALAEALAIADVVKLGDAELAACAARLGHADLVAWLLEARTPRARLVAITRGAAGSTLCTRDGRLDVAGVAAAPGGDNVGCGDAFVAVLAHGVVAGWPLPRIGAVASRWAAAVAAARGATPSFDAATVARLRDAPIADGDGAP
ncbi:MAG: carbohydrate kinase [Kofleriaceae bacterium]|nr:carbohydrate kinase [Kofleriaceae bacterium]MCB9571545.1 carbohydrate kinase [Kofleriaceae bacterium]